MTAGVGGSGLPRDGEKNLPSAIYRDPPVDSVAPAQTLPQAIPSGDVNLNAILYRAAGPGPHPTVLLLHGLPGNEQNIDLAQAMRRAGWNVLTIHYRGSWGGPGNFSFKHCLEDASAALDWVRAAERDTCLELDRDRIIVIGHSMGGFVAAHVLAERLEVQGAVMISGVDLSRSFGNGDHDRSQTRIDEHVGFGAGLHILAATSPEVLADEARANADQWRLTNYAARLVGRPLLMITSDDGFAAQSDALADKVDALSANHLTRCHFATDHSYSDCRIGLQTTVLRWLSRVRSRSGFIDADVRPPV